MQGVNVKKRTKNELAAILGGAAVAFLLVIIVLIVYFCFKRLKRLKRRAVDAESSFPFPSVEWQRAGSANAVALSAHHVNSLRQLTLLDLERATRNFNPSNNIGEGAFGIVYKGLLEDGSIVAVKRRLHYPIQSLIYEVKQIASINHKHLVKLVGFCEEKRQQLLVYDYLLNGNVGSHLYDNEGLPIGKLNALQRLLIAIDAAKGLEYLHGLLPPILHMHFKTKNVLVDEMFTAKVSDFGLFRLMVQDYNASPSSAIDCFTDPELKSSKSFSARSDVYSFGVFLLELISGREASSRNQSNEQENLVLQAKAKGLRRCEDIIDKTIKHSSMHAMEQMRELALLCIDASSRRPSMKDVVAELERIRKEIRPPYEIEDIGNVTLGSELFSGSSSTGPQSPTT